MLLEAPRFFSSTFIRAIPTTLGNLRIAHMARKILPSLLSSPTMKPEAHLVVMAIPAWGHVRPLCAFVARVVQLHPAYVTFLIAGDNVSRVRNELAQYFLSPEQEGLSRYIRVIGLGSLVPLANPVPHLFYMGSIAQTYEHMYGEMLQSRSVTCAWTGDVHQAFPSPTVVIVDICSAYAVQSTRTISGRTVPVLAWVATPASSLIRLFGDESRGGIGDLGAKIYERAAETGQRAEDVSGDVYRDCEGAVVRVPGLPEHYDHEWHPQEPRSASRIPWVIHKGYASLQDCDGAISISSEAYEPVSTKAVHEWFQEEGKEFFAPGPLTVPIPGLSSPNPCASISGSNAETDSKVQNLLDLAFEKYGKQTLFYIAFGSVFWPKDSNHVWELIYTLLDLEIPFIFSHASFGSSGIPKDVVTRVTESGIGLMLPWTPQQLILSHPATGWFLSHCGANSIMESLYQGIPLICWPQEGDQPANALYLSTALDVSFELLQVRTGLGRRKVYRDGTIPTGTLESIRAEFRDVLSRAKGPSGERKRENALKVSQALIGAWSDAGVSRETMARFISRFVVGVTDKGRIEQ
ncbi:glycosyltransferase family 1 protein [Sphaerobolus stellatus SS14]|uniref:Glycosyltransferase family 1 protein n=1 Tax=Sphaerobolus stellatus (strain SS14) TaxID=990650 RepID=A0A0C9VJW5_SPHS4|nr:glycosyltransferase family 1 protein [Sphaerobolus stellatus SS14]